MCALVTGVQTCALPIFALVQGLGCAVLLGASRKGFIGKVWPQAATPKQRLPGSLAAALVGLQRGVQIVRVHDVAETCQAVALWQARSEEHTSELQSLMRISYAVFCLKKQTLQHITIQKI